MYCTREHIVLSLISARTSEMLLKLLTGYYYYCWVVPFVLLRDRELEQQFRQSGASKSWGKSASQQRSLGKVLFRHTVATQNSTLSGFKPLMYTFCIFSRERRFAEQRSQLCHQPRSGRWCGLDGGTATALYWIFLQMHPHGKSCQKNMYPDINESVSVFVSAFLQHLSLMPYMSSILKIRCLQLVWEADYDRHFTELCDARHVPTLWR